MLHFPRSVKGLHPVSLWPQTLSVRKLLQYSQVREKTVHTMRAERDADDANRLLLHLRTQVISLAPCMLPHRVHRQGSAGVSCLCSTTATECSYQCVWLLCQTELPLGPCYTELKLTSQPNMIIAACGCWLTDADRTGGHIH